MSRSHIRKKAIFSRDVETQYLFVRRIDICVISSAVVVRCQFGPNTSYKYRSIVYKLHIVKLLQLLPLPPLKKDIVATAEMKGIVCGAYAKWT